jgi:hypothetical protein
MEDQKGSPLTWDKLQEFNRGASICAMVRLIHVQKKYNRHIHNMKTAGKSVDQYVREDVIGDHKVLFCKNAYPYWTDEGIHHYLLWMIPGSELDQRSAIDYIINRSEVHFGKKLTAENLVIFKNHVFNQSIKSIQHYQVFIRP